jgi:uncharacterized lipoprotein YddW (UPF0748 family)
MINILFIFNILILSENILSKKISNFPNNKQELRAVWVTPLDNSTLITYKSKETFIENMNNLLDVLTSYNMNAVVFHIRTHNDALYNSKLNPLSKFWENVNFNEFDPLKWLIDEVHKRGIEFHAWLNPYRVKAKSNVTKKEVAEEYQSKGFTNNPASEENNLLLGLTGTIPTVAYMNPALSNVREFIKDTILEIISNYNVDAIHFDDYFYYNMGANGALTGDKTIIDEEDQTTYLKYIEEHPETRYKPDDAFDKADWRREQVSSLINLLHEEIKKFNKNNNRYIQFGISPSGVWKSGDGIVTYNEKGDAISNGSKTTTSFEHYGSYLFADTLLWINNEWIDYMLPQTYWASDHPMCPYLDLMDWWNRVVKYKKVNIYSGHGLYMADGTQTYGWSDNKNEFSIQLKFLNESSADGSCVYHFSALRCYYEHRDNMSSKQIKTALIDNKFWNLKTIVNEIKSFEKIYLGKVQNFKVENKLISFSKLEGAKFYAIYRKEVDDDNYILLDVIGGEDEIIKYKDNSEGNFEYNVKPISYSNTLGEPV